MEIITVRVLFPLPSTDPKCVKLSGPSNLKSSITMSYRYLLICVGDILIYSKTCLKRNAIVQVLFSVFTGFRFTKGCVLIKQSTKNMIA